MNRRWRTQESTLHMLSLLGGWPGAWWAQVLFHHKTRKTSFQIAFAFCALLNIALLLWAIIEPQGPPGELLRKL